MGSAKGGGTSPAALRAGVETALTLKCRGSPEGFEQSRAEQGLTGCQWLPLTAAVLGAHRVGGGQEGPSEGLWEGEAQTRGRSPGPSTGWGMDVGARVVSRLTRGFWPDPWKHEWSCHFLRWGGPRRAGGGQRTLWCPPPPCPCSRAGCRGASGDSASGFGSACRKGGPGVPAQHPWNSPPPVTLHSAPWWGQLPGLPGGCTCLQR